MAADLPIDIQYNKLTGARWEGGEGGGSRMCGLVQRAWRVVCARQPDRLLVHMTWGAWTPGGLLDLLCAHCCIEMARSRCLAQPLSCDEKHCRA